MVNLVPLVLPDDKFDRIYAIIKPYIQSDTLTKNDLHQDLYNIIMGAYQKDWVNDFENGPTVAERKKIIAGFAYELEALHKRYINIKKYYPDLIDPETNNTREQIPEWLSFFTNQIDFNNL